MGHFIYFFFPITVVVREVSPSSSRFFGFFYFFLVLRLVLYWAILLEGLSFPVRLALSFPVGLALSLFIGLALVLVVSLGFIPVFVFGWPSTWLRTILIPKVSIYVIVFVVFLSLVGNGLQMIFILGIMGVLVIGSLWLWWMGGVGWEGGLRF